MTEPATPGQGLIRTVELLEGGHGNVPPLMHELRHALDRLISSGTDTIIDIGRLPLSESEEIELAARLGQGAVRAEIDALGPSRVHETRYAGVWSIAHLNAEEEVVSRFIAVTRCPEILGAPIEDIVAGRAMLEGDLTPES